MKKLTAQQRIFVLEYLTGCSGAEAARKAGYSRNSARQQAHQLLKNSCVLEALTDYGLAMSRGESYVH